MARKLQEAWLACLDIFNAHPPDWSFLRQTPSVPEINNGKGKRLLLMPVGSSGNKGKTPRYSKRVRKTSQTGSKDAMLTSEYRTFKSHICKFKLNQNDIDKRRSLKWFFMRDDSIKDLATFG